MFFGNDAKGHHVVGHQRIRTFGFDMNRVVINFRNLLTLEIGHET